jgi:hypothetical protein
VAKKLSEWFNGLSPGRTFFALAASFAAAHGAYYLLGVRFDDTSLAWYWQYLDPALLKNKLLESVFYLHSQPPLFNLFLGAVLKLSGGGSRYVFHGVYLAAGLALYLSLFWLQLRLGVGRGVAYVASTAFVLSPSFVLYEHWLFYAFPLAALVTLSALLFYEVVAGRRAGAAAAFFACLFLVCGIRHTFHLAYYAVVAAAVVVLCSGARRKVLLAAAAPFAVLFSFYAKNYVLFGEFTASTWTGMNLWQMTSSNLTVGERTSLIAEGKLSEVSRLPPFSALSKYPPAYADTSRFADVEVLSQPYKSTGPGNLNHVAYVGISRAYFKDALHVLKRFPHVYPDGLARSWLSYFRSSTDYESKVIFFDGAGNLGRITFINGLCDRLLFGKVPSEPFTRLIGNVYFLEKGERFYLYLLLCLPLLFFYGVKSALGKGALGEGERARARRLTVLYVCFNIFYVAFVVNGFSWAETNRMRFPTDPLYVVLLGVFVQYAVLRGSGRARAREAGAAGAR